MTSEVLRVVHDENPKSGPQHEWLVTNGLGGFASATVLCRAGISTEHITFRLIGAATGVRLRLRPFISFRQLEAAVDKPLADGYGLMVQGPRYEVYLGPDLPTLTC